MQVYKGLSIITARPSPEDEAAAEHRLYGWLEPDDICTAQRWRNAAMAEIADAHSKGRLPIICGGTGFYIETLMNGLPPAPDIPADVRRAAREETAADPEAVHARLAAADPVSAARIAPTDAQRISRALEVWRTSGQIPSVALKPRPNPPNGLRFPMIVLMPDRDILYERINQRAATMAKIGALEEAITFMQRGLDPTRPSMKAVGLREFAAAARNEISISEACERTAQASRRYAKRQLTWLRHRTPAAEMLNTQYNFKYYEILASYLEKTGLTAH